MRSRKATEWRFAVKAFHLKIVTPDGVKFDSDAESVLVKTDNGDVEILAGHIEYFAPLGVGRARIISGGEKRLASAAGGFISVTGDGVNLVATTFEFADEIDINRAKAAKERAEASISGAEDEKSADIAKAKLLRALNRISVAESFKER